ncbi:MAG: MBL fold metallo-hydrolase RNA specificity domain-containing protein [Chloroflexota bacterium]
MNIQFHGAVRTVTGSQHLINVNGKQILLDCGLYQGRRHDTYERNQNLPFDAAQVDVLVLSHAHIDHSGNIPNLVKSGFQGDIVCTYATRDLCAIMLRDSAKIQEQDIRYLNRKRARKDQPPVEPLYTMSDAVASLNQFTAMGYDRSRQIMPGVTLTLLDAGHILGSAIVVLDIEDREAGRDVRVVFSGDLGRPDQPIIRDPQPVHEADVLLLESTYGTREHEPVAELEDKLEQVVNDTYRRGGKVIVPAFAIGRTQELVYYLHQLARKRDIPPDLKIFVDSPLAIDATGIYRLHPEAYDRDLEAFMLTVKGNDPFGFDMMRYTRSVEQSKELNFLREPAMIISASGMAEAGRILHHLKNNVEDSRNTVLIVGWQAPHTLGRRLVEKRDVVKIFGEEYRLHARVETINGFSAHADRSELLDWVGRFQKRPRQTFVVHGDEDVSLAFAKTLQQRAGLQNVRVPKLGQKFEITD